MIICKEFTFDAAHKLENYVGKCANLHGHTYKLQIYIQGEIKENGLVMDFKDVKAVVKEKVIEVLDHKFINEVINRQTSAENITLWIWEQLEHELPLYEVRLWETPTSFAMYSGHTK
jgi:6-pyruvoyltetrahydropterin/6-carboxytetrahydropterin synthase